MRGRENFDLSQGIQTSIVDSLGLLFKFTVIHDIFSVWLES